MENKFGIRKINWPFRLGIINNESNFDNDYLDELSELEIKFINDEGKLFNFEQSEHSFVIEIIEVISMRYDPSKYRLFNCNTDNRALILMKLREEIFLVKLVIKYYRAQQMIRKFLKYL